MCREDFWSVTEAKHSLTKKNEEKNHILKKGLDASPFSKWVRLFRHSHVKNGETRPNLKMRVRNGLRRED